MTIKLKMIPQPDNFHQEGFGIHRVVDAYFKYLPRFDIDLVPVNAKRYDIKAVHAGMTNKDCDVAHLHGLYFTADYPATNWEYKSNENIVNALHYAKQVTVPSSWVTEVFQRDMRFTPHIIPHGIEWQEWQHTEPNEGYVLWNKGRKFDVCSPDSMGQLALAFPQVQFLSTFMPKRGSKNISELGTIPHQEMKKLVQRAGVYLSTTKETFGLGVLEAMASGVPVLGWRFGGNVDLVQHGVNGYLATPNDLEDLKEGLLYCLEHNKTLGDNGREMAKVWTWERACEKLVEVYKLAMEDEPATVSVVIPVYNKTKEEVLRAITSCKNQTVQPDKIVVIYDGIPQEEYTAIDNAIIDAKLYIDIETKYQNNQGVANARNNGIALTKSKYICCLDADDWIEPLFLERCVTALEKNSSLGIAYTSLRWYKEDGKSGISNWPGEWDFDRQVNYKGRQNQVPTCCVFKREMWERLGGYRQRYAPMGAGAEDAEFWTRSGAYGYRAEKVTAEPLFNYSMGGSVGSNPDYQEVDWLAWHPWSRDGQHPFASYAMPRNELLSHPVRQYDEPKVSVIIPVGPGHEKSVIDALDSLEAQSFRNWEVIVVDDTTIPNEYNEFFEAGNYSELEDELRISYPYVRHITTPGRGAGYARNRGVEIARAPLLLFLDADDTLHPECLTKMLEAWSKNKSAIYSDYVGQAYIEPELAGQLQSKDRLQVYNGETQEAIIKYRSHDYNCKRAVKQPNQDDMYIWNLITTLFPKSWHYEIGGFDEEMETWEDWDYWIRMAKIGKCFYRIPEELIRYRFYTGERRSKATPDTLEGRHLAQDMLKYMTSKEIDVANCSSCPGGKRNGYQPQPVQVAATDNSNEFVKVEYLGSKGSHPVYGPARFSQPFQGWQMRRRDNGYGFDYGYHAGGDIFYIHREDFKLMKAKFSEIEEIELPAEIKPDIAKPVRIAQEPIVQSFNLQSIAGITPKIAQQMAELGLDDREAILNVGAEYLVENIKGVAEKRAEFIIKALEK
jgi:glycosyltransferase involved in cell wall biosynthesis